MSNLKEYIENYNYVGWLESLSEQEVRSLLYQITDKLHDLGNKAYEDSIEIDYEEQYGRLPD